MRPRHLYIHAPFCARRCSYCDFAVQVAASPPVQAWLDATTAELELTMGDEGWAGPLRPETVYLGGGTPSLLGPDAPGALRARLAGLAEWEDDAEWTVEANPESFDQPLAGAWRSAGVSRVSLGAQTFHEPALRWMGRLHGAAGPGRAVRAARAAGFDSLSIDLIFALPERLGRDWSADLDRALALEPEHVSIYGLTAEADTPLGRWVREGRERLPDEGRYEAEYLEASERLTAAGYVHYEVSNFALPGHTSRHNRAYWSGAPYVGLGLGAHSFVPPRRWWNVRDWAAYRAVVSRGERPIEDDERIDGERAALERYWLGLRADGVDAGSLTDVQTGLVEDWARNGWAELDGTRIRLTRHGWLLLDRLALELAGP